MIEQRHTSDLFFMNLKKTGSGCTCHASTHTNSDRLLSLCQINSHFLPVVDKCFGEFPKGCRRAPSVRVCLYVRVRACASNRSHGSTYHQKDG